MAEERADEATHEASNHGGDLTGRVAVVTGANSGIGRATALDLAGRGAAVVLACRSEEKARATIDELRTATGNEHLEFLALDLASLAAVRRAADELLATDRPIHVLVNNAGLAGQRGATADGFELAFGTNHLGHFLFPALLLARLRASASPGVPARVANVSSGSHFDAKGIDFDAVRRPTRSFVGMKEYSVSKLTNVCFTQELARREDPATLVVAASDPGPVDTNVWRRIPGPIYAVFRRVASLTPVAEGAASTIFAATDPGLDADSGAYVDQHCRVKPPSSIATPELGAELWERSEAWVAAAGTAGPA